MSEPNAGISQIKDKQSKIAGLLPKNTQARLLGSIALVMVLVILFSGRKTPPAHPQPKSAMDLTAIDPNQERIQEYRARIEGQTRELALEEEKLAKTKQTAGVRSAGASFGSTIAQASAATDSGQPPERNWIELDREKREYQGLFESNIALSLRRPSSPVLQLLSTAQPENAEAHREAVTKGQEPSSNKRYHLMEGTLLETVLTNRLDSSFSGPVNCMVTANVYSRDGLTLLVPQGTRVLGEVKKLESFGQQRLAVFFHRLIMPDGYSASLDQFQGLNQIGETGLRDQVNHHYLQIFGVSLAIGAIAGLAQANTRYGTSESGVDIYEQGVTASLSQTSMRILDRYLNVLPTMTIREGHRVKVYLSQDLALSAYAEHQMPSYY
jgi:type IV secretion system protein VirB10